MSDLFQQDAENAPVVGATTLGGSILSLLAAHMVFARKADVDLASASLEVKIAKDYVRKDELQAMRDDITYIRQRFDQIVDKR